MKQTKTNKLSQLLKHRIEFEGPLSVADFMTDALGHPEFGYYQTQEPFGKQGDFTTAPEISQMFGEIIAAFLIHNWHSIKCPQEIKLIELGPGRGTLMADILRTIQKLCPDFFQTLEIHFVEMSKQLQTQQENAIVRFNKNGTWHASINDVPEGFSFIIANEFFDALPIHQYQLQPGNWMERKIHNASENSRDDFEFVLEPLQIDLPHFLPESLSCQASVGDVFEFSSVSVAVMNHISERLTRDGGLALILDYGHKHSGLGDTLQAVEKHKYCNPLSNPGFVDITAHVDFDVLVKAAKHNDALVYGPVDQRHFLLTLGIEQRADALSSFSSSNKDKNDILSALGRLTDPDQMGNLFKVLAISSKHFQQVPGFN